MPALAEIHDIPAKSSTAAPIGRNAGPLPVDEIRRQLFEGTASVAEYAAAVCKSERVVHQWCAAGMPVVYFGRTPRVILGEQNRAWHQEQAAKKRGCAKSPPRRRGRPRKSGQ